MIKVSIAGFRGKLGSALVPHLQADGEISIVGGLTRDPSRTSDFTHFDSIQDIIAGSPDVYLEVAHHEGALHRMTSALHAHIPTVIGTTGFDQEELDALHQHCLKANVPALYAPNFAVGAILMMKFAEIAAKWFPDVEVIELHHEGKADSPSGTAMMTLNRLAQSRTKPNPKPLREIEKVAHARGGNVDGIHVHSVRLPGLVAHQIVQFGGPGEGLKIVHDAFDRACYGKGAVLAVKGVRSLPPGLHQGLDTLLFGTENTP